MTVGLAEGSRVSFSRPVLAEEEEETQVPYNI